MRRTLGIASAPVFDEGVSRLPEMKTWARLDTLGRFGQRTCPGPNLRWPLLDGSILCKCKRAKEKDEGCQSERSHASHYFATFFGLRDPLRDTHLAGNGAASASAS